MFSRRNISSLGRAARPSVQPQSIPASVGGVNALTSFMGMAVEDAMYLFNIVPSEYGLRLRKGYREWATGCPSEVRSIIPYDAQTGNEQDDKLFAVCAEGIYDVTLFGTDAPVQEVAFADATGLAGYGVHAHFTTDSAENLILFADEVNGLHYYNGDTQTWFRPTITFPDATTIDDIAFITTHKQRVWLVKQGAADAYYLPIDAIQGNAQKFNFGSKFQHGGALRGLWSWTVDGGDGVDDFLVALSGAGDVLVYYGPDPSQPEWSLRGSYYIGETVNSRKVAVEHAAELYLLSTYGVTSIRSLLSGVDESDVKVGPSAKISRFLRSDTQNRQYEPQWQLTTHPQDGFMQIVCPPNGTKYRHYVQNLLTSGWGWWTEVPITCAQTWRLEYYIGGPNGIVYIYDGGFDGAKLDGDIGKPIDFGGLTSFQPYGQHGQYMQASFIRTIGVTQGIVGINTDAVYDYDIEALVTSPPPLDPSGRSIWDIALWDFDFWDYTTEGNAVPIGSLGLGRTMAIGFRGSANSRITIVGWDVMFKTGGLL